MRFICPTCVTSFDVPDGAVGALVTCTRCGTAFPPGTAQTYVQPPTPVQVSGTQPASRPGAWEGPPAGTRLGGYTLEAPLGSGGMGVVYRAVQTSLGRPVALKVLPPQLASDPQFVERFHREAMALAALSHPRIVSVIDRGMEGGMAYLAMELVEGESLRQRMQRGAVTPREAARVALQVCEGLSFAHGKGVVHRDVKPENLLLNRSGDVKIADFGLARIVRGDAKESMRLTVTNMAIGTPFYMAPEQMEGAAQVDGRADLYSLGVVLYEALTGGLPIGRFDTPREKFRDVDPRLDGLVMRLLEKDPTRRPSTAEAVASALRDVIEKPVPPGTTDEPTRLRPAAQVAAMVAQGSSARRVRRVAAFGIGLIVAVGIGAFVFIASAREAPESTPKAVAQPQRAFPPPTRTPPPYAQQAQSDRDVHLKLLTQYVEDYTARKGCCPTTISDVWDSMKGGAPEWASRYAITINPKSGVVEMNDLPVQQRKRE